MMETIKKKLKEKFEYDVSDLSGISRRIQESDESYQELLRKYNLKEIVYNMTKEVIEFRKTDGTKEKYKGVECVPEKYNELIEYRVY